jgi:hypothetical protein
MKSNLKMFIGVSLLPLALTIFVWVLTLFSFNIIDVVHSTSYLAIQIMVIIFATLIAAADVD